MIWRCETIGFALPYHTFDGLKRMVLHRKINAIATPLVFRRIRNVWCGKLVVNLFDEWQKFSPVVIEGVRCGRKAAGKVCGCIKQVPRPFVLNGTEGKWDSYVVTLKRACFFAYFSFSSSFWSISTVIELRSYCGFQSHSARAQLSSSLSGQLSAMPFLSGSTS